MATIVTLLTDFGWRDPYVAEMKAAIYRQWARFPHDWPLPRLVDLTHDLPAGDIAAGAWFLRRVAPQFPAGSVHVAVVDPGVGTERPAVAASAAGRFYVAPGNGLLAFLAGAADLAVVRLDDPLYRQPPEAYPGATTFDGRDLFAPVAAHLALGVPLVQVGSAIGAEQLGAAPTLAPCPAPSCAATGEPGGGIGRIVWIDRFGNAVTDVTRTSPAGAELAGGGAVQVAGRKVAGPVRTFADGPAGRPFWYWGSGGTLEIAVREGSATVALRLERGMAIGRADRYDEETTTGECP